MKLDGRYLNLAKIADSGQCFRMTPSGKGFEIIASGRHVLVYHEGDSIVVKGDNDQAFWKHYFDLKTDYPAILASVDPDDVFLQTACAYSKGLCILNQEPFETLISFIISQRKSIKAIRICVEKLADRFGEKLGSRYLFPTPKALANANLQCLQDCAVGYRAAYIQKTAQMVASGEVNLNALYQLNHQDLVQELCHFPGVGVKVASCVSLFAYHNMEAFPRDVWIMRVEEQEYGGRFPEEKYPHMAGFLQQCMFFYGKSPDYRVKTVKNP
jgi:N-glycosylase/DNA lyase